MFALGIYSIYSTFIYIMTLETFGVFVYQDFKLEFLETVRIELLVCRLSSTARIKW